MGIPSCFWFCFADVHVATKSFQLKLYKFVTRPGASGWNSAIKQNSQSCLKGQSRKKTAKRLVALVKPLLNSPLTKTIPVSGQLSRTVVVDTFLLLPEVHGPLKEGSLYLHHAA